MLVGLINSAVLFVKFMNRTK